MESPATRGNSDQSADPLRRKEIADLRRDIENLEIQKGLKEQELKKLLARPKSLFEFASQKGDGAVALSLEEKVALFLELFGARRDVYPKFWENAATGIKGYSPAYKNDRQTGVSGKIFLPLDERAVEEHLRGNQAIGVYALRTDDSCIFLAADFDGDGWRENVLAYHEAAEKFGVTAAIERSRSGNGAHAWVFFAESVPAAAARSLGTILLAKASSMRPTMSLDAYDRLFPNQDTMPRGGFGNLIALPLAGKPRKIGNTVFLDESLEPYPDQWGFLGAVERLAREDLDRILGQTSPMTALAPVRNDDIAFALESDECALDLSRPPIRTGMISGQVTLRFDSRLHIPRAVPSAILAALKRLATFANPEFHRKLRLRFSTYDTPRFIFAGEWHPDRLVLPRGSMDEAVAILESAGATVAIQDARPVGKPVRWTFHGELRPEQAAAVQEMAKHDYGVLCAPPGAGKTVMGCALIARHLTSTLVLVHRTLLLDQWRKEAGRFLGIVKRKEIGIWRGATRRLTRKLDIAMLPSLTRVENYAALFEGYGLVVVDECHHVPAATFEALLKACPCRKIVGLTATPVRKDGLEKLLHLQCGPIRHAIHVSPDDTAPRIAYVRRSSFHVPDILGPHPPIHLVWEALVADTGRTRQIVADIRASLDEGRCPLVLSDRRAHLDKLEAELAAQNGSPDTAVYRLESGIGKKQREAIRTEIDRRFETGEKFVLLATASLIGEGYDLPRLDTLFLAMPLSFKGRLVQYAGRLHRPHAEKREVRVYDYLDEGNPLTIAMFRRRSSAYRQMGYSVILDKEAAPNQIDFR
ncbi:MAG: TOTE conflict system archaeo-eukaryotic primase domain-containing protein [Opitutaceae bacterium]